MAICGNAPLARQALRKLLPEPLRIVPATVEGQRSLGFAGFTVLGPLLDAAQAGPYEGIASRRGLEAYASTIIVPFGE